MREDLERLPGDLRPRPGGTGNFPAVTPWRRMVVAVLSCAASHKRLSNYLTIFEPWFQALGLDHYVILAHPEIPADRQYRVLPGSRVFLARAQEGYETLAHKLVIFFDYVLRETDYDYVLKCDDGCLLNLGNAVRELQADYVGTIIQPTLNTIHRGRCADPALNHRALDFSHGLADAARETLPARRKDLCKIDYAGGGYGYRMSRAALRAVTQHRTHILALPLSYEDLLFGQLCALSGIPVTGVSLGRYHRISAS